MNPHPTAHLVQMVLYSSSLGGLGAPFSWASTSRARPAAAAPAGGLQEGPPVHHGIERLEPGGGGLEGGVPGDSPEFHPSSSLPIERPVISLDVLRPPVEDWPGRRA